MHIRRDSPKFKESNFYIEINPYSNLLFSATTILVNPIKVSIENTSLVGQYSTEKSFFPLHQNLVS